MNIDAERKLWFDYISKLNDRSLNRQRASGFTTWAIVGVIVYLSSLCFNELLNITASRYTAMIYAISTSAVFNISIFAIMLFSILHFISLPSTELRVKSRLDKALNPLIFIPIFVTLATIAILNAIAAKNAASYTIKPWPFWTMSSFFVINLFSIMISPIVKYYRNKKYYREIPVLSGSPYDYATSLKAPFYLSTILILIVGLIISILPALDAISKISKPIHVETVKWSVYFASIFYLCIFLCGRISGNKHNRYLLQLEQRMIVSKMTPTEIRNEFIKEFLGETLRDWFNKSEVKLKQLSEEFDKVSVDCRDKFAELSSIDRNLSYEIKGRKEEICKELNEAEQNYLRYAKKLLAQFKYLISQKAAYVFPDLFTQLTKTIDAHLSDVKALYEAVCKECKLVTINEKSDINCTKGTEQTAVADSVHSPLS